MIKRQLFNAKSTFSYFYISKCMVIYQWVLSWAVRCSSICCLDMLSRRTWTTVSVTFFQLLQTTLAIYGFHSENIFRKNYISHKKWLVLSQVPKCFWSKFFVPDQKSIYILWQSQTFCARQKDDLHSIKLVFVPAQKPILLNANHIFVWHKMFVTM